MDEETKKVCEEILREKIHALQSDYESKIASLKQYYEFFLAKLKSDEAAKRENLEAEHRLKVELLQHEYCEKTKKLEEEIDFLNERHNSQRMMMNDTLVYVRKLEEELSTLKTLIAKGDRPAS